MAAGWNLNNNQKLNSKGVLDDNDLVMKYMLVSQKPGIDLMQNCDLPPPIKVFSGSVDKTAINPTNKRKSIYGMMAQAVADAADVDGKSDNNVIGSVYDEKLELLKALRLSQTRAREAEIKYSTISKEKDLISFAVLDESMQVFAYRQLVKLLELQLNKLNAEKDSRRKVFCGGKLVDEIAEDDGGGDGLAWVMALAFCLGIAGVGLAAFGCKCYWF